MTAPDWNAVAEALTEWDRIGAYLGGVYVAARWALEHGPALEAAEEVEIECRTCEGGGEVYNHGEDADCDRCVTGIGVDDPAHMVECPVCGGWGEVTALAIRRRLLPPTGEAQ